MAKNSISGVATSAVRMLQKVTTNTPVPPPTAEMQLAKALKEKDEKKVLSLLAENQYINWLAASNWRNSSSTLIHKAVKVGGRAGEMVVRRWSAEGIGYCSETALKNVEKDTSLRKWLLESGRILKKDTRPIIKAIWERDHNEIGRRIQNAKEGDIDVIDVFYETLVCGDLTLWKEIQGKIHGNQQLSRAVAKDLDVLQKLLTGDQKDIDDIKLFLDSKKIDVLYKTLVIVAYAGHQDIFSALLSYWGKRSDRILHPVSYPLYDDYQYFYQACKKTLDIEIFTMLHNSTVEYVNWIWRGHLSRYNFQGLSRVYESQSVTLLFQALHKDFSADGVMLIYLTITKRHDVCKALIEKQEKPSLNDMLVYAACAGQLRLAAQIIQDKNSSATLIAHNALSETELQDKNKWIDGLFENMPHFIGFDGTYLGQNFINKHFVFKNPDIAKQYLHLALPYVTLASKFLQPTQLFQHAASDIYNVRLVCMAPGTIFKTRQVPPEINKLILSHLLPEESIATVNSTLFHGEHSKLNASRLVLASAVFPSVAFSEKSYESAKQPAIFIECLYIELKYMMQRALSNAQSSDKIY